MRPKEVDVIIEEMGVTYESLSAEDFGDLKLENILLEKSLFTPEEWKSIEQDIVSFIEQPIPAAHQPVLFQPIETEIFAEKGEKRPDEPKESLNNGEPNENENHKELLARILEEYEQEEKLKSKAFANEQSLKEEEKAKHPFESFEEEGSRIVDTFRKFDIESKFVVTKYFESRRALLTISNFEKGEVNELSLFCKNSRASITAVACVDGMIACGLENGSVIALVRGENEKAMKYEPNSDVGSVPVSCLDLTTDQKYIVAGYENGFVVFWDSVVRKVIKALRGFNTVPIVQIRAYMGSPSLSNGPCCILSDASGESSRIRLDEKMFMFFEDFQVIIKEIDGIVHHLSLSKHKSPSGNSSFLLLAYASESKIMVVCVEPDLRAIFQFSRPDFVRQKAVSHVGWCTGSLPLSQGLKNTTDQAFLVVGWEKHILLFSFDGIKGSLDQSMLRKDLFKAAGTYEHHSAAILFLAVIGVSRIAILDGDQKISLLFTGNFKPIGRANMTNRSSESFHQDAPDSRIAIQRGNEENGDRISPLQESQLPNEMGERGSFENNEFGNSESNPKRHSIRAEEPQPPSEVLEELKGPVISQINAIEEIHLKFHILLKDSEGHPKPVFTNHVASQTGGSKIVFCDLNSRVFFTKIYSWQEYIERMIENGEWLKGMTLSLDLYKGRSKHFGDLAFSKAERKAKVRDVLKDLCLKYSEKALEAYNARNTEFPLKGGHSEDLNESESEKATHFDETICLIVIDILVSSKLFEFLFSEVSSMFQRAGLISVFVQALEPFILSRKIKKITDSFLKTVARHYQLVNRTDLIQALIMSLDPSKHDLFFLLQICLEYKLFTTLIYICPRHTEPDFSTPFVKLYSEARVSETHKDYSSMSQQLLRMLWYLNMTIKGERFPHEQLSEESHIEALTKLLPIILNESILYFVLLEEPKITFEVLLQIFNPSLIPLFYEMNLADMGNHTEIMKGISTQVMKMADYVKNHFFLFVCDAANKCNLKVDIEIVMETLDFFLNDIKEGERHPSLLEVEERVDKLVFFLRQNEEQIKMTSKSYELREKASKCPL